LQTLLAGFGGLDITDNGVEQRFTPTLPKSWKKLVLKGIGGSEKDFVID
jgi:trehalose/maltose hydrolase-like predicted phosphorylase